MDITEDNINEILGTDKLVPGKDIIFAATGITSGPFLKQVNLFGTGDARVHSISMGSSGVVRFTESMYIHDKEETPLRLY